MSKSITEILQTVPKNTEAVIKTRTEVKMNKNDVATKSIPNPFTTIYKIQEVKVLLNPDYEQLVNQERWVEDKPQDFKAAAPVWGEPIGGALVKHNDVLYVTYVEQDRIGSATYILPNAEPISKDKFVQFMPVKKESSGRQEVSDAVQYRKVKLENIISVTIGE